MYVSLEHLKINVYINYFLKKFETHVYFKSQKKFLNQTLNEILIAGTKQMLTLTLIFNFIAYVRFSKINFSPQLFHLAKLKAFFHSANFLCPTRLNFMLEG